MKKRIRKFRLNRTQYKPAKSNLSKVGQELLAAIHEILESVAPAKLRNNPRIGSKWRGEK